MRSSISIFPISMPRWTVAPLGLALLACGSDGTTEPPTEPLQPAAIVMVSGDDQEGKVGEPLGEPFVVRVTDAHGEGVAGVEMTWRVASGAGHFGLSMISISMDTNPDGIARVFFRPGALGTTTVAAEVAGLQDFPVIFTTHATVVVIRFLYGFGLSGAYGYFAGPEGRGSVDVPVGTTVEWAWDGAALAGIPEVHIVSTSAPPGGEPFDSGILRPGDRFRFTPGVAGTWEYEERLHGPVPTTGTLTVQ